MRVRTMVIFSLFFSLLAGCSKTEKSNIEENRREAKLQKSWTACKYSNDIRWENGINFKEGNQFFIKIKPLEPIPFQVGQKLRFAASGDAVITQIFRHETDSYSTIFVTVNIKLDAQSDGHPHTIIPVGME